AGELAAVTNAVNTMEREASAWLEGAAKGRFTEFDVSDFPLPKPKSFGVANDRVGSLCSNMPRQAPAGLGERQQLLIQHGTETQKVNVTAFFPSDPKSPDRVTATGDIGAQGQALNVTVSLDNTVFRFDHALHCELVGGGLQVTDVQTRTNLIV